MLKGTLLGQKHLSGAIQHEVISNTKTEQEKTVNPATEDVIVLPDRRKTLSKVTVKAVTADIDSNIQENNIRAGVTILGKIGNLAPDKPDQVKTTIPSKERQHIKADTGYELAENIVEPIPDEYADITGVTASAEDVLNGKVFVDNQGNEVQGTAELKEDLDAELTAQDEAITNLENAVDSLPTPKADIDEVKQMDLFDNILSGRAIVERDYSDREIAKLDRILANITQGGLVNG
jgi:hypothetical protein